MNWLYYLAEANLYLGVFYLAYCLFLTKETYYQLTRAYLLFACIASFTLPVLQIGALKPVEEAVDTTVNYTLPEYTPQEFIPLAAKPVVIERHLTADDYLVYAYFIGAAIVFLMLMIKLFVLFRLMRKANRIAQDKHKLIYLPETNVAFSFFNYLFIGTNAPGSDTIIRHELVHIRQKHSVDIVFLELLKIVSWFNPFIYLLQNSLKTVHEYIADEQTAAYETDALTYSSFLVNNAYGAGGSSITHSFFNYNLLKKRIVMLNQKRSGNLARLKYLIAVPVCAGLLCASTLAFSKTYGWVDIDPAKPVKLDVPPLPTIASDGYEKLITHLSKTMRYDNALVKPTNVLVVINFRVKADGKLTDAKITKSGGSVFDALAMNALKSYKGTVNAKPGNRNIVFDFYANNATPAEMAIVNGNLENRAGLVVIVPNQQGPGPVKFPPPVVKRDQVKFPPPVVRPDWEKIGLYFSRNIKYPTADRQDHIAGRVITYFAVDADHNLQYAKVVRTPSAAMGDEVIRTLKACTEFSALKPGVQYVLPVAYTLGYEDSSTGIEIEPKSRTVGSPTIYNPNSVDIPINAPGSLILNDIVIRGYIKRTAAITDATKPDLEQFYQYLSRHILYPSADRKDTISGRVITVFAVDANGNLQYAKVVRTPSEAMGNQVMRVLKKWPMFSWFKPGVQYAASVTFTLGYEDSSTGIKMEPKYRGGTGSPTIYNPNALDIPVNQAGSPMLNDVILRGYIKKQ